MMKNLLNCHCKGVHSFPISFDNDLYKRVFYADYNHELWKPIEVAIHPHHVDIKITVLYGKLYNPLYAIDNDGESYQKFQWNSHILNGNGGFEHKGTENLKLISNRLCEQGDIVIMKACELHTIQINKGEKCVWLIEESKPTCDYFPLNYSLHDLTKWKPDGLYFEVSDAVKNEYLKDFNQILYTT